MTSAATRFSEALLDEARDGDDRAIARLLSIAQPDIRRYARRNCRNASDIDDAVQETLILLYRRVSSLRAVGSFSAWLFTIVDRVCLRLARKAMGRTNTLDVVENDPAFSTRSDADLSLDLAKAIQSLPPHYRNVVLMRDIEELTIDEIAVRLSGTRAAVKAQLHRARTLVREYISH
jgi:RNA polymerase sigma factor (sigma-70 family)